MFINKTTSGKNNLSGLQIRQKRKSLGISQRMLADQMQLLGLDIDKNAIQRIESGQRFITDIELSMFARFFRTTADELINANSKDAAYPSI